MNPDVILTQWQKKQAALLYRFSSLGYLEGLMARLRDLTGLAGGILDKSRKEDRDLKLRSKRWGNRNTSENWGTNGWCFLGDFELAIERSMVEQRANIYHRTGAYQCARGMSEYSMHWTTPEEQDQFDRKFAELYRYAGYIDKTMDRTTLATRWDDFGLTVAWQKHAPRYPSLPKLRVDTNIGANSGQLPPRTGVYVSADDVDATLQFAWTGSPEGRLLDATTFNAVGRAALAEAGRGKLWVDGDVMLRFVRANSANPDLMRDTFFEDSKTPDLAPSLVARNSFMSHPSRWYYVELVKDEFEPIETE